MANINVSAFANFVTLTLSTSSAFSTATNLTVKALQDVTITNNNGVFRWKQLDSLGQKVAVTPATNSINLTLVLDDDNFYGQTWPTVNTSASAYSQGLFNLSNQKELIYFQFGWGGGTSNQVRGQGYLSGLAPKVTPDQPVWITPLIIEVDSQYTTA
jgi:hypothetical protein